ncbi:MAG: hypothetical protein U5K00_04105 [Melioribacteraceae bacterium]|nr:hypothetical protein [Melioribacteraceae bacterium]
MSKNNQTVTLNSIISDNTSGSRELLQKLNHYLSNHKNEIDEELIYSLQDSFSEFQSIKNYLTQLNESLSNDNLDKYFRQFEENQKSVFEELLINIKPEIEQINSFITISNSQTILELFKLFHKEKSFLRLTVCEGRPNNEGRILAEKLSREDIAVSLITEAQIYDAVQKVECGIIGADKILPNGNVVNKVGSNLLALACKEFNKPFFVVTDKSKFANENSFDKKEKPADEIYSGSNKIKISNYYFEEIPKELITKVITN